MRWLIFQEGRGLNSLGPSGTCTGPDLSEPRLPRLAAFNWPLTLWLKSRPSTTLVLVLFILLQRAPGEQVRRCAGEHEPESNVVTLDQRLGFWSAVLILALRKLGDGTS